MDMVWKEKCNNVVTVVFMWTQEIQFILFYFTSSIIVIALTPMSDPEHLILLCYKIKCNLFYTFHISNSWGLQPEPH